LRLAALPVAFLLLAKFAPVSLELKRVLVVQAAMPSGMMPLVLARHYGGQPLIAAQIIVGTTLLGLLVIPLWLYFGLAWVGG
jgi:predicted permease